MTKGSYIPDYDNYREKAIYKLMHPESRVAFKKEIENQKDNPFPTPSGKIEIFCDRLADMNSMELPPIPKYIETWESREDALAKQYPLQLITTHFRRRAHGQFDTVPWLRELEPQSMLINSRDAHARGISNEDKVEVFNERGRIVIVASVTERIIPGTVDIPQGAWYSPSNNGVDFGGNPNVLTKDHHSPGGASTFNTCLVQVKKL